LSTFLFHLHFIVLPAALFIEIVLLQFQMLVHVKRNRNKTLKQFQCCFRLISIFILMLKNIHDANLFQPITLRRLDA